MKTILTISILVLSICAFGQTLSEADLDKAVAQASQKTDQSKSITLNGNPYRNRTPDDTIGIAHVGFPEASQKMFNGYQTEIAELQKQLQEKVKLQDDMFALLCGAAVPPVDPKKVIKDGVQIKPGELILKYRK